MAAKTAFNLQREGPATRPVRPRLRTGPIMGLAIMIIVAILWLVPLWSIIITPMKSVVEYFRVSPWALPEDPANLFLNIQQAWTTAGLGPGFVASLFYGVSGAALAIFFASLGAYAITRLRVQVPFFWFMVVFSGTIFPFQMYLIPLFQTYVNIGLYDTVFGMVLFYTAIAIPFCLFVMRGFFSTVPWELQEAARLDGCRDFGVFWRIFLPLARGPIAVLFLFQFTWIWNDLIFGLVLSKSDGVRPIMPSLLGMQGIFSQNGPPTVLAGALVASMPTVVLFLILRRYMIRGLTLTVAA
jgi:ABC-type glycerol-3-phosphate transport system permease component